MTTRAEHIATMSSSLPAGVTAEPARRGLIIHSPPASVPQVAVMLTTLHACEFATMVVEEGSSQGFTVRYLFYAAAPSDDTTEGLLIELITETPAAQLPAISDRVHAADWHEREAEDMFGLEVEGHPFLGDFVLHDAEWREGVGPMRRTFDPTGRHVRDGKGADWQPRRILQETGAIVFPVGPIWGDYHESGLWLLETPGEQIREAHTRLFYKFRGVEKIAEGQPVSRGVLLAERFSGSSAVAHALAWCQAVESIANCQVPPRALALRLVAAELERIRYHAATIAELAGSTGLAVGKAMAQELEEALLRLTGETWGHRYLFGIVVPGGLAWQPDERTLRQLDEGLQAIQQRLDTFEQWLTETSSFLDRIEEMGTLTPELAATYGAVGPVGRASARALDLRRQLPYGDYSSVGISPPMEIEGDGFARMRIYFAETRTSTRLIHSRLADLPEGPVSNTLTLRAGSAHGWSEAPAGAAFHWVRIDDNGTILRWRIGTPGMHNWHAFHRALEGAAFQDFPIILASFGLSIAENDR